jgi:predicted acylesterase/phospholipase RssA
VADAVYASLAIPGGFSPFATPDGRLLVNGGVLNHSPVVARTGEGLVIAVGVTGRIGQFTRPQRPGLARGGRPIRRVLTGGEAEILRLGETIVRTVAAGSIDTVRAARPHADVGITPPVDAIGLMDRKALPLVVEAGRQAAREPLAANPDLPSRLAI